MSISPEQKKLKIQVGVCQRLLKEVGSYEKEVIENEAILERMRGDSTKYSYNNNFYCFDLWTVCRDSHDIRKFEEVLQESYMMVPDSKRRLEVSIDNLRCVLV